MRGKKRDRTFVAEAGLAVFLALTLDSLGEPPAVCHPVVWYGKLIQKLEQAAPAKPLPQFLYGFFMLLLAIPAALLPAVVICWIARRVRTRARQHGHITRSIILYVLLEGMALKPFFALRMLVDA